MAITVDKERAAGALEDVTDRLCALLRSLSSDDEKAMAVGDWSVKHVAAHLAGGGEWFPAFARDEGPQTPTGERSDNNEAALKPFLDQNLAAIEEHCRANTSQFLETVRSCEGDPEIRWLAGIPVPLSAVAGIFLVEGLVHGFDIARAAGKPWTIDPDHARIGLLSLLPSLPYFVRAQAAEGFSATYDVRIRGGNRFYLVFEDGKLSVEEPSDRRVDCHISADPVAYLLVGYGRLGQWGPVLRGKIVSWGRKPMLGAKFGTLFERP